MKQLKLPDLGFSLRNRVTLRQALFLYYKRKSGRSFQTWKKNVIDYPHPRRFNLVFRSFIKNRVQLPVDVSEQSIPSKIHEYVIKYYPLVETNRIHDKAAF